MNGTEERLRAATMAAALTVADGSAPPLVLPGAAEPGPVRLLRPRRPGWRRALAPLAAAAAVISVVGTLVAVAHLRGPAESPPAGASALSSVPPYFVYLNDFSGTGRSTEAIARSTATGHIIARVRPPQPYRVFDKITAIGTDDHHFLLMAQRWRPETGPNAPANRDFDLRTPGALFTLTIGPGGASARLAPLAPPAITVARAGYVAAMAASPDGRKLAVLRRNGETSFLQILNLATRAEHIWRWIGPGWAGEDESAWQPLSWQDDSRTLAFQAHAGRNGDVLEVRLFDSSLPNGGSLELVSRTVLRIPRLRETLRVQNILVTGDGRLLTGLVLEQQVKRRTPAGVREYSVRTGRLLRTLDQRLLTRSNLIFGNVLWVSSSGSSMVVAYQSHGSPPGSLSPVFGVLTGNRFTRLPFTAPLTGEFAW
jgi:hypothetical protein